MWSAPRAAFAWVARKLKGEVAVPLVATNRINAPDVAERIIADGSADMVSMARPLLADAEFVAKAAAGDVVPRPVKVEGLPPVVAIAAGFAHTCAVDVDAKLWCWGTNASGELGSGVTAAPVLPPRLA